MNESAEAAPQDQPSRYDAARQFLMVEGVIARDIATFPLASRPKRRSRAAAFDGLGGNTTMGIHLSEVPAGGEKAGHRHLDEATFYIVSGHGWTELRQSDERSDQRVEWRAGDVVVIPANAYHKHYNGDPDRPCLQLAFKDTRLLRKLFHSREFVYRNDFRFHDRYDDEPDYWTRREPGNYGKVRTNLIPAVVDEAVEADPEAGQGVSSRRFSMGGHRMLDLQLVEVAPGGYVRAHRHLAEEALLILRGAGRTHLWAEDGREVRVDWSAGDLVAPPFGLWRQHVVAGDESVRYLAVRNTFIERALGIKGNTTLDGRLPERFPTIVELDREALARDAAQADAEG
ncbi:MAG TPA: cupin domain-containing protein [Candidatus Limnocylindrales bacterium]|nr:cupin domain-containing protein [Candidatus Limnocylindrales bacterium]